MREVDSSLLENLTISQNAATPAAAFLTLPVIFLKIGAINKAELLADAILQILQKLFNGLKIRLSHNVSVFFREFCDYQTS